MTGRVIPCPAAPIKIATQTSRKRQRRAPSAVADASGSSNKSPLALVLLGQHASSFGAHDAGVGQLALLQLLAKLRSRDVHRLPPLRGVLLDEPNATEFRIVGREADLHRVDLQ